MEIPLKLTDVVERGPRAAIRTYVWRPEANTLGIQILVSRKDLVPTVQIDDDGLLLKFNRKVPKGTKVVIRYDLNWGYEADSIAYWEALEKKHSDPQTQP